MRKASRLFFKKGLNLIVIQVFESAEGVAQNWHTRPLKFFTLYAEIEGVNRILVAPDVTKFLNPLTVNFCPSYRESLKQKMGDSLSHVTREQPATDGHD
jgi:hypothetical protein